MMVPPPKHCRPEAYHLMAEQLDRLDQPDALWKGAVSLALHHEPRFAVEEVDGYFGELAQRIRGRAASGQVQALLAHGHDVLFREEGFQGNRAHYYDPANSYLPLVIRRHRGIPITLSLVYKCVMERAGLDVDGINAPGHFLVAVRDGGADMYVNAFDGGRVLTREEVFQLLEESLGSPVPRQDTLLAVADHRAWLVRMLRNLIAIFRRRRDTEGEQAMRELLALLTPHGRAREQGA